MDLKKRQRYLFCAAVDDDPAFEQLNRFKIIEIFNKDTLEFPVEDFVGSTVIFDDLIQQNNREQSFLFQLSKACLGRGERTINEIVFLHDSWQGNLTKVALFEAESCVVFPKSGLNAVSKLL